MKIIVLIDTMHLSVKYPKADVFDRWFKHAIGIDSRKLRAGIPVGDFVVRGGSCGYKISVWQHDARVYLTDEVDDKRGKGNGMGLWVQLGPKFLIHHMPNLQEAVNDLLTAVGVQEKYPIRITRLDIAVDLLGVAMSDQDIKIWKDCWVGRSKLSGIFNNSRTGILETFYIGSRKSPVFLRIYDKVAQSVAEGDIEYWRDLWGGFDGPVTRAEWEIKPNDGNFSEDLKNLELFNGFSRRELIYYLLDWGRLCDPDPSDSNRRRWNDSLLWAELRELLGKWADGVDWPTSRFGKTFHGISERYAKFLSGTIAGGMARFGEKDPSFIDLIDGLAKFGEHIEAINKKAADKAAIYSKL